MTARLRRCRRDPAPSRAAYRMQRLWLTPLFRVVMRVGVAGLCRSPLASASIWPTKVAATALADTLPKSARKGRTTAPNSWSAFCRLKVHRRHLDGAIRKVIDLPLPQSSFDLDLEAARARIATLDAVADAELRVQSGGVLQVTITSACLPLSGARPRRLICWMIPAAAWPMVAGPCRPRRPAADRRRGRGQGRCRGARRSMPPPGPCCHVCAAWCAWANAAGISCWTAISASCCRKTNPCAALERLIALDQAEDLLARDVFAFDLRNQDRPVLRLAPYALHEMRRAARH